MASAAVTTAVAWDGDPSCGVLSRPIGGGVAFRAVVEAPLEALFGERNATICGALRARKVHLVKDLVYVPAWELRDWLLLPEVEAEALLAAAWAACAARPSTAWDLSTQFAARASASCNAPAPLPSLRESFGGGGLAGSFVEVAGPPGVGKTQFCLHAASLAAAQGGEVFWIDTERTFAPQRLLELLESMCSNGCTDMHDDSQEPALEALARIRRRFCASLPDLHSIVAELAQRATRREVLPSLIIIDSVASVARLDGGESRRDAIPKRQALLNTIASLLKGLVSSPIAPSRSPDSRENDQRPAVLVTNQVSGDPVNGGHKVTLGNVWHHAVNWRLVLSHDHGGSSALHGPLMVNPQRLCRLLLVEKSPCTGPLLIRFSVSAMGLQEEEERNQPK
mmetsp:Transcript_85801/g.246250  ORF Transcript_85801/g.246250 Transcript_85801/m.246250 type:complete len:395 (+) Transcript_85801:53-1237(+)